MNTDELKRKLLKCRDISFNDVELDDLEDISKITFSKKTDSKEKIIERFKIAYKEINEVSKYNYVVVNDEVDNAVSKIEAIIKAEKCRVDRIEEVLLNNEEEYIHELLIDME